MKPSIKTELGFGAIGDDPPGSWYDLSDRLLDLSIGGGYDSLEGRMTPFIARATMDNRDRLLDPEYSGGLSVAERTRIRFTVGQNYEVNPRAAVGTVGRAAFVSAGTASLARVEELDGYWPTYFRATATPSADGYSIVYPTGLGTDWMQVAPGDVVFLRAWARRVSGTISAFSLQARGFSSGGVFVSSPTVASVAPSANGWHELTATYVVPAGVARLGAQVLTAAPNGAQHVWDVGAFQTADASEPYVDAPTVLFDGFTTGWPQKHVGLHLVVPLTMIDGLGYLQQAELTPGLVLPEGRSDEWIAAVLDDVGWAAGRRALDVGWSVLQSVVVPVDSDESAKALDRVNQAAETEGGLVFQRMDGKIAMLHRRTHQTKLTNEFLLGSTGDPDELPLVDASDAERSMLNDVRISRLNGETARAVDQGSIDSNGRSSLTRNSVALDPNEPLDQAVYILDRASGGRLVRSVALEPSTDPRGWFRVLTIELGQRGLVRVQPYGNVGPLDQYSRIIGREVTIPESGPARVKYTLDRWDTDNTNYWILGDATRGILGSTTILGY